MMKPVVQLTVAATLVACASTPPPRPALPGDATAVEPPAELPQALGETKSSAPPAEMAVIPSNEPTVNGENGRLALIRQPEIAGPPSTSPSGPGASTDAVNESVVDRSAGPAVPAVSEDPDLHLTQRIRNALVADESLSFAAKTVRILVAEGKVTLRGAVENEREWKVVNEHAERVAGGDRVDNQVKVQRRLKAGE